MSDIAIEHLDRLELAFAPHPWPFAIERRAEIDAYFAELQRANPAVWNGRVLLLYRHRLTGGVLSGAYLEADFASFSAWRAWGRLETGVRDCFAAAAIIAADGAVLLGVMGAHTSNAGRIYFPCGTPDLNDVKGNQVDLEASVWRELKEETGFAQADFTVETGWTSITDGPLIALIKVMRAAESADALQARARLYLATERQPELADLRIVRGPCDFDPAMPPFVTAFLARHFAALAKDPDLA